MREPTADSRRRLCQRGRIDSGHGGEELVEGESVFDFAFLGPEDLAVGADEDGAAPGDVEVWPVEAEGLGDLAVHVGEEGVREALLDGPLLEGGEGVAGDADDLEALGGPARGLSGEALHLGAADAGEGHGEEGEGDALDAGLGEGGGEPPGLAVLGGEFEVRGGVAGCKDGVTGGEMGVWCGHGKAEKQESGKAGEQESGRAGERESVKAGSGGGVRSAACALLVGGLFAEDPAVELAGLLVGFLGLDAFGTEAAGADDAFVAAGGG